APVRAGGVPRHVKRVLGATRPAPFPSAVSRCRPSPKAAPKERDRHRAGQDTAPRAPPLDVAPIQLAAGLPSRPDVRPEGRRLTAEREQGEPAHRMAAGAAGAGRQRAGVLVVDDASAGAEGELAADGVRDGAALEPPAVRVDRGHELPGTAARGPAVA